jgi:ribonuclease Z
VKVTLLGTGSPLPDPGRAGPATLVQGGGATVLVDCGRGVLQRAAAVGVGARQLTAVLLTHLHSDHLTDLGDLITTRWIQSFEPDPLRIVGPPRTREVVDGVLASLRPDVEYRLAHHADLTWEPPVEVEEVGPGELADLGAMRVVAAATEHRPAAPSLGYRFGADGHIVVVAGDTLPCEGLDRLCAGADVLVHTVIREDVLASFPVQRLRDVCDDHSSVEQAAETAARAGVRMLVLTHLVPAPAGPEDEEVWRAAAAARFDGEVVVGRDLDVVEA